MGEQAPSAMEMSSRSDGADAPRNPSAPLLEPGSPPPIASLGCGICYSMINTGSIGVVQKMGEYVGVQEPGCGFYCPIFTSVTEVSLAVQQIECKSDCKTKDNVTVTVATAVQYR